MAGEGSFQKWGAGESVGDSVFYMKGACSVRMGVDAAPGKISEFRIEYLAPLYCGMLGTEYLCHP